MQFVNLTPHQLNIFTTDDGREVSIFPPSGEVARIITKTDPAPPVGGIPTVTTSPRWELEGLPGEAEGVILIVSGIVARVCPRDDVMSPGELVRDDKGRPIGCRGLRRSISPPAPMRGGCTNTVDGWDL
jgi:hypothetical protein